jgi:hypothetical protein
MMKSETIGHLAAALARAQAEMPVAAFDATNPFLKTKYATLGSVIQASRPILAKHKLSLVQFPITDAMGIGVVSVLAHESGEFMSERVLIPLMEEKGKSKVQSAGSTLTYIRRYSWASILGMYSDEDSDGAAAPSGVTGMHLANASGQSIALPPGRMPGSTAGKMPATTMPVVASPPPSLPPPPQR